VSALTLYSGDYMNYVTTRIIGRLDGATTLSVINLYGASVKHTFDNPMFVLPIPQSDNTAALDTKLINLRRVTERLIVEGYLVTPAAIDETYMGSIYGIASVSSQGGVLTNSGSPSDITGDDAAIKCFYLLANMARSGASSGKGCTFQHRPYSIAATGTGTTATFTSTGAFTAYAGGSPSAGFTLAGFQFKDANGKTFNITSNTADALTLTSHYSPNTPASGVGIIYGFPTSQSGLNKAYENRYHEKAMITNLEITDSSKIRDGGWPSILGIKMTLYFGSLEY